MHFVDQAAWLSFLNAGLGLVKEGGALVFADEFPEQEQAYGAHVLCRPMSAYLPILAANGFVQDSSFAASLLEATGQNSANIFVCFESNGSARCYGQRILACARFAAEKNLQRDTMVACMRSAHFRFA